MMEIYDPDDEMSPRYFIGLDLGQAQDYTALAVIERRGPRDTCQCAIPALKRYPLGTAYPAIVQDVAAKLDRAPAGAKLIIDSTGVGRPVTDMILEHPLLLRRRSDIYAVTITGGDAEGWQGNHWRVPKRNLVGAVQVLLQSERLKIAVELPDTRVLIAEMQNFKVTISTAGHDSYSAWRENQHDDLVLAVALACWASTHAQINAKWTQGEWRR